MHKIIVFILIFFHLMKFSYSYNYKTVWATVKKVYDGDTVLVVLQNRSYVIVRLWGIDAPESSSRRYGYAQYLGYESALFVRNLLLNKKIDVTIPVTGAGQWKRDCYKRVLGYISYEGRDLSSILLRKGYARVTLRFHSSRHSCYLRDEANAKRAKNGIWEKKKERRYYRALYVENHSAQLLIWFWRFDPYFLRYLLLKKLAKMGKKRQLH